MLGIGQLFRDQQVHEVLDLMQGDLADAYTFIKKAEGRDNALMILDPLAALAVPK